MNELMIIQEAMIVDFTILSIFTGLLVVAVEFKLKQDK